MATSGQVNLTIADGGAGAISLPANEVQVVMGCCSAGTPYTILATRQPSTLQSTFEYGPLPEAGALSIASGATVLAMRIPTTTAGTVVKKAAKSVSAATNANPVVVTTTAAHGLTSGDIVTIASVAGNTAANGTWPVTVLTSTTFSIPVSGNGAYTSGGTVTPTGTLQTGSGTSEITFSGAAYDDYFIQVDVVSVADDGAIGTDTIQFTVSLDAGRTLSRNLPRITLDTSSATTYLIPQTGITVTFGTGAVAVGDRARCYTTGPQWAVADVVTALEELAASPYAESGWGSIHLVGTCAGTDADAIGDELEEMALAQLYDRMMASARDASPPTAWGGTGETDSAWSTAVIADFAEVVSKRLGVSAGHYNMRSQFKNPVAGLPVFRRPLSWAWAARVVELPTPADHEGWVRLRSLQQIVTDPVNDPQDGFVYHDEQSDPVFDNLYGAPGRMTAARKRRGKRGWFIADPLTLAEPGSDFQLMPRGRVMDLASDIIHIVGGDYINQRVKLNRNGTIRDGDANGLESAIYAGIDDGIGNLISGRTIAVNRTNNVLSTGQVNITGTILGDGFVLEINMTLGYGTLAPSASAQ